MQTIRKPSIFTPKVLLVLLGAVGISLGMMMFPHKVSADNASDCVNNYNHGNHSVYGSAWFVPGTLEINPGEVKQITLRTFVCNPSPYDVSNVKDYYGPSKVQETGITGPVDYSPSGLPDVFGYRELNMGSFGAGGTSRTKDFTVNINGSAFGGTGTYHITINGFGIVTYDPSEGVGCMVDGHFTNVCPTNKADSIFALNIVRRPPEASPVTSGPAACDSIKGWAYDPDNIGSHLTVQLFVDRTPSGAPDGTVTANQSTPHVPSGHGSASGPGHGFDFNVSAWKDNVGHSFYIRVLGVDQSGHKDGVNVTLNPVTTGVCVTPSCNIQLTPSSPEAQEPFTVTTQIVYAAGSKGKKLASPAYKIGTVITNSLGGIVANDDMTFTNIPPSTGGKAVTPTHALNAGVYGATSRVYNTVTGANIVTCTSSLAIVQKPYLSIYGNDVCSGGAVKAFLNTANNAGAGSQLATFARTGTITGYASAKLRSAMPQPPNGLSFANTSSPPGNFAAADCGIDISTLTEGTIPVPGNITLAALNIGNSTRATYYTTGNIIITGNIIYGGAGGWVAISDIPQIKVIAKGNIYIDKSVTKLDGIYVAGGTIYTCTDGANPYTVAQFHAGSLYDNCSQQLVIHGSLTANSIKWLRTYKSLKDSTPSEHPYAGGAFPNAAEVIIDGPESYISQCINITCSSQAFDAITALPPVL